MVFTNPQLTAFFGTEMGLNQEARRRLEIKGLTSVDALGEWTVEALDRAITSIEREGKRAPDPATPTEIPPPFSITMQSVDKLRASINMVRYYQAVGREPTPANMKWIPFGKFFEESWEPIAAKKTANNPEPPLVTKALPILPWISAFQSFLLDAVGARSYPLAYIIRTDATPPNPCPANAPNRPHATEYTSVIDELVARLSHERGQYASDNGLVFTAIQTAVMGTPYSASVEPFKKAKDGRAAYEALNRQHAGEAVWKSQLKKAEAVLHTSKWTGQSSSYSLEKFVGNHREAYLQLEKCSGHVQYQLPNDNSRITYVLDGIECSDPGLQAVMAMLRANDVQMNNFEAAVAAIIPSCPVAKLRTKTSNDSKNKRSHANISEVNVSQIIGRGPKTGVEFRYYKRPSFLKLTQPMQDELNEHRRDEMARGKSGKLPVVGDKGGKNNGGKSNKKQKKGKKKGAKNPTPTPTPTPPASAPKANVSALTVDPDPVPKIGSPVPTVTKPPPDVVKTIVPTPTEEAVKKPRPRSDGDALLDEENMGYWGYPAGFLDDVVKPDPPKVVEEKSERNVSGLNRYRIVKEQKARDSLSSIKK
jgi:hypothetical protein